MEYFSEVNRTISHLVSMTEHDEPYRLKKTLVETIQQIIGELKIDMFEVIYCDGEYIQRNCLDPDRPFAPERRASIIEACKNHQIQHL